MDGTFVQTLVEKLQQPAHLGDFFVVPAGFNVIDPVSIVKPGPTAKVLGVASLSALRDYLMANRDGLALDKLIVHVVSPSEVTVSGPLVERTRHRESYITATAQDLTAGFLAQSLTVEQFIVGLQTRFVSGGDLTSLMALFSNVKHEAVKTSQDDGVTQVLQTKAGIALVGEQPLKNPVRLAPFRTFREVPQPGSAFTVRVMNANTGQVQVTLLEADGGHWRAEALEAVRKWLVAELPTDVAVLA